MNLWQWLEHQGVPGFVLGTLISTWASAIPIGRWIHRVTERRHQEQLQVQRQANDRMLAMLRQQQKGGEP